MPRWTPEQEEAINKSGSNIIVSAGAGSGKTAVLSQRVLNKIDSGIHVNELLILTFTKAAASEMKERIRKKILSDPKYSDEVKLINSSYITTFDSFALSVVKKYHYLLNISSDISISDESIVRIKENEIIDKIFDELYLSHNNDFENLILKYSVKNDKEIKKNILKVCNIISSKINYQEYINNIKSSISDDKYLDKIYNEYLLILKEKRNELNNELSNLSLYLDNKNYEKFYNCVSGLLTCDLSEMHLYKSIEMPKGVRYSSDEAKEQKERFKSVVDEIKALLEYGTKEEIIENIKSTYNDINIILDIVLMYIDKLNKYKKENNIYTFNDIAFLSIKVLKDNIEVREELKNSFKEIMIDEYQDTNDIQDEFIKLIENNNVYMVGDIKQSIYKFRGSNPFIFKSKYDSYSKGIDGYKIDLIKNFRSRDEVLNSINRIFELLMDDYIGNANYKESHEMVYGNTSYDNEKDNIDYNASILEYNESEEYSNSEIEMFLIAKDIKDKVKSGMMVFDKETSKLRKCKYSDFVIILDRSKLFTSYKKVFEYNNIPLTILKDESLSDNSDLYLIRNIIDFIIHIENKIYDIDFRYDFVSIARSFLYEYSDQEIFDVIKNNSYYETNIYKDLSSIVYSTSDELLINILNVTDYFNKLNKVGDYLNTSIRLKSIFSISNNLNNFGYDINDFKKYLDDVIESGIDIRYKSSDNSTDSVRIMTIHASKGLEYPVCYFADLYHKFNNADLKEKFLVTNSYGLIESNELNVLKELYKHEYNVEEISERLRLFYVALTRAREKIIIVLPNKEELNYPENEDGLIDNSYRTNFKSLSDFIYSIKEYISDYFDLVDIDTLGLTKKYLYKTKLSNKILNSSETINVSEINIINNETTNKHFSKEQSNIISKSEYDNMKYGTLIHKYLEYIDFNNYDNSIIKDEKIRKKIDNLVKNIIKDGIINIYKEYEFIYVKDNIKYNGIIDLMIEYNDSIDIIDYKLKNIKDEKYKDQLNGYKKYIESISDKKINLYLYSILDEKIEII